MAPAARRAPTARSSLHRGQTVTEDNEANVLTGSAGQDWFFFDPLTDRATDLNDEVFANDLGFIGPP